MGTLNGSYPILDRGRSHHQRRLLNEEGLLMTDRSERRAEEKAAEERYRREVLQGLDWNDFTAEGLFILQAVKAVRDYGDLIGQCPYCMPYGALVQRLTKKAGKV